MQQPEEGRDGQDEDRRPGPDHDRTAAIPVRKPAPEKWEAHRGEAEGDGHRRRDGRAEAERRPGIDRHVRAHRIRDCGGRNDEEGECQKPPVLAQEAADDLPGGAGGLRILPFACRLGQMAPDDEADRDHGEPEQEHHAPAHSAMAASPMAKARIVATRPAKSAAQPWLAICQLVTKPRCRGGAASRR